MPRTRHPRHLLATDDWPDEEILALLDRAEELRHRREPDEALHGRTMAAVFFAPSLRTRASFEAAMLLHGGHTIVLEPGKGSWGIEHRRGVVMDGEAAEHVAEAAAVLGRYADVLGVRAFPSGSDLAEAMADGVVRGFAEHAGVPVINMESARRHPCQGLADALTLRQRLGPRPRGRRLVLAWCWHPRPLPTAVPVSAAINAVRLGVDVTIARPPGFDLHDDDMEAIHRVAARNGAGVDVTDDLDAALAGADAVYAKSWGSLRHFGDPEGEGRTREPFRDRRIDGARMAATRDGFLLHCLPVRRNVVVTDEVLDGPRSAVIDQAENRLHVQRAVLRELLP